MGEPIARGTIVGRYEIVHELATGGMGMVYLGRMRAARGVSLNVAIKRINPALAGDPRVMGMFIDEARISAVIRHLIVVQTLDVVEETGELLLVMEYVHGVSLARLLAAARERGDRLPLGVVSRIGSDVLHGLHAAHETTDAQGKSLEIVHRDVSPQNVLVGVDGVARVADFGIARATTRVEFTRIGEVKGKLRYIAPEQFEREQVDRRADIYGAGLVLWEMIVGRGMRRASAPGGLAGAILTPRVEPPSTHVPELPPALEELVVRALSINPSDRFPFAGQMAIALEEAVTPSPHAKVAELVRDLCEEDIAENRALLDRPSTVDLAPSTSAMSTSSPSMPVPAQSRPSLKPPAPAGEATSLETPAARSRAALPPRTAARVGIPIGIGLLAIALALLFRRTPPPPAQAAEPAPSAPEASGAATIEIDDPAPPAPPTAPSAADSPAPPSPAAHAKNRRPWSPHRPKGRGAKPDCSIPYTVDAKGIRVPRPECL